MKYLIFSISLLLSLHSIAQTVQPKSTPENPASAADTIRPERPADPYSAPQEFEIGGIEVKNAQFADQNAIISVSGLSIGQKIKMPGDNVPRAIRNLWKLKLFTDVRVNLEKRIGDIVFLSIYVQERPRLSRYSYQGVKRATQEDVNGKISRFMNKGSIITEDMKTNAVNTINTYYIEEGFLDVKTAVREIKDTLLVNSARLVFDVKQGKRVRVREIAFEGNQHAKSSKLRDLMKGTNTIWKIFSPSKFNKADFEDDKKAILTYYNNNGYRDARILNDTVLREGNLLRIKLKISEGNRYVFRKIAFKGNTIYPTERLREIVGIEKGDPFDAAKLEQRMRFSQDNRDISSLYMDNGYLFFRIDPIETSIDRDSIDYEVRIFEGPQATIDQVTIKGNDRTHEHVIRRELRTKPGQKFSRSDILRSQREIIGLGYFNQEKMTVNTPVNAQRGTVDVEYGLEEKPSDQLELSAGYGGLQGGLIGTLGVTFNNFSLKNLSHPETWSPLPQGDGQRLSIRAQTTGELYQSYNISFTEPWLGGKRPNAFSASAFLTQQTNGLVRDASSFAGLTIKGLSVGLGTRLKRPDDFFVSNTTINLQNLTLARWSGFTVTDKTTNTLQAITTGDFYNFSINQTFSRNSIDNPIFPTSGSRFILSAQLTPPYSLLTNKAPSENLQERFKFVEYQKYKFTAEWFTPLGPKFVLRTAAKMGFLGYYNEKIGLAPFERFQLGGDGITGNFGGAVLLGIDLLALRGYEVNQIEANSVTGGSAVFNKYTVELRYPFMNSPSTTIYTTAFLEAGNAWRNAADYNPLTMYRSAGMGLRVFLPMFGTLGFDYGLGLDKIPATQKDFLTDYGRFTIILGFEPE